MEYTVGSIGDLISGQNTPDKSKVVSIKKNKKRKNDFTNSLEEKKYDSNGLIKKTKTKKRDTSIIKEPVTKKQKIKKKLTTDNDTLADSDQETSIKEEENIEDKSDTQVQKKSKRVPDQSQVVSIKQNKKRKNEFANSLKDKECDSKGLIKKIKTDNDTLADSDQETSLKEEENVEDKSDTQVQKKSKRVPEPEEQERTIFVGNVPIETRKHQIKQVFKKYGNIESLRFRGIPVADPKIPKKVAAIKKEFNPNRKSVLCYIRFENKDDAQKALKENGNIFKEHHLHVELCSTKKKPDETKAIFIGNLSFNAEEDELWKLFEPCGSISSVRIVRDSYTGMGKGFGYVNFKNSDAVQLALEMEKVSLQNRELRIKLSSVKNARNNKKKINAQNSTRQRNFNNNRSIEKKTKSELKNKNFQGFKFNNKKKFKVNKGDVDKKRKMKKVAPMSKVQNE